MPEDQPTLTYRNRQVPKSFRINERAAQRVLDRILNDPVLRQQVGGQSFQQRLPGFTPATGSSMAQMQLPASTTPGTPGITSVPGMGQPIPMGAQTPMPLSPPLPPPTGQPIGNAQALLQQVQGAGGAAPVVPTPAAPTSLFGAAKNIATRPFQIPGTGGKAIPSWQAALAALAIPNVLALAPDFQGKESLQGILQGAGQGAALGAFGGPAGAAIGGGVGAQLAYAKEYGLKQLALAGALGGISPVAAMVKVGMDIFGSDEGLKINPGLVTGSIGNITQVRKEVSNFFESLPQMGIGKEDARMLKTMYDSAMAAAPGGRYDLVTHQAIMQQQIIPLANELYGVVRQERGAAEAERTAYERQESSQQQLIDALTAAQNRDLAQQQAIYDQQVANYNAAISQQGQFLNAANQWMGQYLAPFQSRMQESAANQAAYLQGQAASNPTYAALYSDLAQQATFDAQRAAANQATMGAFMPQQIYAQQISQLAPPQFPQSQGPSPYEQMILQVAGAGL